MDDKVKQELLKSLIEITKALTHCNNQIRLHLEYISELVKKA